MEGYFRLAPFSDVQEGLQNLAGYRKAILSDGTRKMLLNALENSGFDNDFVSVIRSEDARSYKPSPAVYQLAAEKLNCAKEKILFVSSNAWDIAGAARFGYATCWIQRSPHLEELHVLPNYTIKELTNPRLLLDGIG
ncbi:HAD-IA family hydrolase [Cohnella laeviribosi]|uniref:HAD-IA family hydrolase n=1 Tax=Cohnella laeviribosi TaxID=380174 RepID=UPI003D22E3A0